uniref:Uncharacterized protein n=1 Tax=Schizaphis graminum TaxID=13262 RepID=A0A2S2NPH2_SCHGA
MYLYMTCLAYVFTERYPHPFLFFNNACFHYSIEIIIFELLVDTLIENHVLKCLNFFYILSFTFELVNNKLLIIYFLFFGLLTLSLYYFILFAVENVLHNNGLTNNIRYI